MRAASKAVSLELGEVHGGGGCLVVEGEGRGGSSKKEVSNSNEREGAKILGFDFGSVELATLEGVGDC